jgi:hypothetical protein
LANWGVDVCATAELVKPAHVNAISIVKAVMGTKGPLRTKYLLISNLVWAWMVDRYDPVALVAGRWLSELGALPWQHIFSDQG